MLLLIIKILCWWNWFRFNSVNNTVRRYKNLLSIVRAEAARQLESQVNKGISTVDLVNLVYNFCCILTGINLYPYQEQYSKRVIRSILTNDSAEITALFSRQSGKSEAISVTVAGCMVILPILANMPIFALDKRLTMFKGGLWVGIFAPSQRQAQITYGRIKKRLQNKHAQAILNDPEINLFFTTSNGQTVSLNHGSFATSISASEQSNIEGESFMLLILEECQDIANSVITKSIHPMGAAYNATICKIGTATTFRANFYYSIQRLPLSAILSFPYSDVFVHTRRY